MKKLCLLLVLFLALSSTVPVYAFEIEDEPERDEPVERYSYTISTDEYFNVYRLTHIAISITIIDNTECFQRS